MWIGQRFTALCALSHSFVQHRGGGGSESGSDQARGCCSFQPPLGKGGLWRLCTSEQRHDTRCCARDLRDLNHRDHRDDHGHGHGAIVTTVTTVTTTLGPPQVAAARVTAEAGPTGPARLRPHAAHQTQRGRHVLAAAERPAGFRVMRLRRRRRHARGSEGNCGPPRGTMPTAASPAGGCQRLGGNRRPRAVHPSRQ